MSVAERILAVLSDHDPLPVTQTRVGRKYTAVALEDGSVGVALTQLPEGLGCCDGDELSAREQRKAETLLEAAQSQASDGRSSADLLRLLPSKDPVLAAVGLACANALTNREDVDAVGGDILDCLDLQPSDTVGMVGFFGPLVPPLRKMVSALHIFERRGGPGRLPADEGPRLLPECDVALITAASIANSTADDLLDAASSCREVVLLGASTPLLPSVFAGTSVSWLSGSVVMDGPETLRVVAEGGGRREFNPFLRKGNLRCA